MFQNLIAPYIDKLPDAIVFLEKVREENKDFAQFFNEAKDSPLCKGYSIHDLLLKPLNRLKEYAGFTKLVLKYTPASHPDYSQLQVSNESLVNISQLLEEKRRSIENLARLIEIQQSFKLKDFVNENRVLVKECIIQDCTKNKPKDKRFCLFNDVIIIGSVRKASTKAINYHLADISLVELPDGATTKNMVELQTIKNRDKKRIAFSSLEEKQLVLGLVKEHQQNPQLFDGGGKLPRDSSRKPRISISDLFFKKKSDTVASGRISRFQQSDSNLRTMPAGMSTEDSPISRRLDSPSPTTMEPLSPKNPSPESPYGKNRASGDERAFFTSAGASPSNTPPQDSLLGVSPPSSNSLSNSDDIEVESTVKRRSSPLQPPQEKANPSASNEPLSPNVDSPKLRVKVLGVSGAAPRPHTPPPKAPEGISAKKQPPVKPGAKVGVPAKKFPDKKGVKKIGPKKAPSTSPGESKTEADILCAQCNQLIQGNALAHKGNFYHDDCYKCHSCRTSLAGLPFAEKDGVPYCKNCAINIFAEPCAGCGEMITSQFLSALGAKYHPECFLCFQCKANISSGYGTKGNRAYCPACIREMKKQAQKK